VAVAVFVTLPFIRPEHILKIRRTLERETEWEKEFGPEIEAAKAEPQPEAVTHSTYAPADPFLRLECSLLRKRDNAGVRKFNLGGEDCRLHLVTEHYQIVRRKMERDENPHQWEIWRREENAREYTHHQCVATGVGFGRRKSEYVPCRVDRKASEALATCRTLRVAYWLVKQAEEAGADIFEGYIEADNKVPMLRPPADRNGILEFKKAPQVEAVEAVEDDDFLPMPPEWQDEEEEATPKVVIQTTQPTRPASSYVPTQENAPDANVGSIPPVRAPYRGRKVRAAFPSDAPKRPMTVAKDGGSLYLAQEISFPAFIGLQRAGVIVPEHKNGGVCNRLAVPLEKFNELSKAYSAGVVDGLRPFVYVPKGRNR